MAEPACFAGIVAALDFEAAAFKGKLSPSLRLEVCGMGDEAAARAARRLLQQGAGMLVSFGTAGALGEAGAGAIMIPDRILGPGNARWACDPALIRLFSGHLSRRLPPSDQLMQGSLMSVGHAVVDPGEKRRLRIETGAEAVDLESAAIAKVAAAAGSRVPFLAVRVIVDAADRVIPQAALLAIDGSASRPLRMLPALVKSPGQIPALVLLGLASRRANRSLRLCAGALSTAMTDPAFLDAIAGTSST